MRVGPRMSDAVFMVRHNPGCPKITPARAVAPHGSLKYGYATVNRAIAAGLITAVRLPSGVYRLHAVRP